LSTLTNLTVLELAENQIRDVSPLRSLTNLTSLNLNNNQITDASSLGSLTNLGSLYLIDNPITDISFLRSLTNVFANLPATARNQPCPLTAPAVCQFPYVPQESPGTPAPLTDLPPLPPAPVQPSPSPQNSDPETASYTRACFKIITTS
jgi:Leucine Rich repeats (2 copies)